MNRKTTHLEIDIFNKMPVTGTSIRPASFHVSMNPENAQRDIRSQKSRYYKICTERTLAMDGTEQCDPMPVVSWHGALGFMQFKNCVDFNHHDPILAADHFGNFSTSVTLDEKATHFPHTDI